MTAMLSYLIKVSNGDHSMHVHIRISVRVLGLLHHAPPLKKKHVDKFRCVGEGSADCGAYVSDDIFGKDVDHVLGSRDNSMLDDENGMHPTVRKTLFWCCRCIRKLWQSQKTL